MKNLNFRTLKATEIEVRYGNKIKDTNKATMLLYIDSRAVTKLLDETVGPMNWNMEFYQVADQTIGKLGIWDDEKGLWVYKSDVGTESNIEAQKGAISDTYKRCLSRWGVTELYSAPSIILDESIAKFGGCRVETVEYDDDRNITSLKIVNKKGETIFNWEKGKTVVVEKNNSLLLKQLTDGCTAKKGEYDVNELKKFFEFWKKKIESNEYHFNEFKFEYHFKKWFKIN